MMEFSLSVKIDVLDSVSTKIYREFVRINLKKCHTTKFQQGQKKEDRHAPYVVREKHPLIRNRVDLPRRCVVPATLHSVLLQFPILILYVSTNGTRLSVWQLLKVVPKNYFVQAESTVQKLIK